MKKEIDPRHQARRLALQSLFEWSFLSRDPRKILQENFAKLEDLSKSGDANLDLDKELAYVLVKGVVDNREKIDEIIKNCAPEWPITQIAKIDLTVLRLSIFEIAFGKTAPIKVAIDEAVEVAKEFGGENSGSFVNGVLGTVVEKLENV